MTRRPQLRQNVRPQEFPQLVLSGPVTEQPLAIHQATNDRRA